MAIAHMIAEQRVIASASSACAFGLFLLASIGTVVPAACGVVGGTAVPGLGHMNDMKAGSRELHELSEEELLAADEDDEELSEEMGAGSNVSDELSVDSNSSSDSSAEAAPKLIRLRRETVPIYRRGKIASFKTSYSGILRVGSDAQEFRAVFDTGSGNIVIPGKSCESESCLVHKRFDGLSSSSAVQMNGDGSRKRPHQSVDHVTIGYGTGEITGNFVRDKVCVISGDDSIGAETANASDIVAMASNTSEVVDLANDTSLSPPPVSTSDACVEMNVIVAVEMSAVPFKTFNFDGIIGLGLDSLAMTEDFSFGFLSKSFGRARFGAFLTDGDEGEESEMAFGGYNPARLLEPLSWAPVIEADLGYWMISIVAVRINGVELDVCTDGTCKGVVDTGTSHLGIPAPYNLEFDDLLSTPAGDLLDCRLADAPNVEFELHGGLSVSITPGNYNRRLPLRADVQVSSAKGVTVADDPKPVLPGLLEAPQGPLGLVFDDNQTVRKIPETSLLEGKLEIGAKLMSVDGVDVAGLSGEEIAATLTEVQDCERSLIFDALPKHVPQETVPTAPSVASPVVALPTHPGWLDVPKGPLGIQFDGNQTIMNMLALSPLKGKVAIGDKLKSIDGLAVSGFTGNEISAKLREVQDCERSLVFEGMASELAEEENVERFCKPKTLAVRLPAPLGPKLFILGEPLLHRYYTVYDWESKSVGFGLANNRRNTMNPADLVGHRGVLPDGMDRLLMQQRMEMTVRKSVPSRDDPDEDEVIMMQMAVTVTIAVSRRD